MNNLKGAHRPAPALVLALVGLLEIAGCMGQGGDSGMRLESDAFTDGGQIPTRYTCDDADVSPPLRWSGAPDGVEAFALVVTDPDAGDFVHWAVADIPAASTELAEGASGSGAGVETVNSFGRVGWGGPCPPSGTHRYVFTFYALSARLGLDGSPPAADVRRALGDKMLAQAQLSGTYARR